jgi:hypothetical protein
MLDDMSTFRRTLTESHVLMAAIERQMVHFKAENESNNGRQRNHHDSFVLGEM